MSRGKEGPRFHPEQYVPTDIPNGYRLAKFHGEPVILPERKQGEPLVGKTIFTSRQVEALRQLAKERYELVPEREEI